MMCRAINKISYNCMLTHHTICSENAIKYWNLYFYYLLMTFISTFFTHARF